MNISTVVAGAVAVLKIVAKFWFIGASGGRRLTFWQGMRVAAMRAPGAHATCEIATHVIS